jgi:hypothetical protein
MKPFRFLNYIFLLLHFITDRQVWQSQTQSSSCRVGPAEIFTERQKNSSIMEKCGKAIAIAIGIQAQPSKIAIRYT